MLRSTDESIVNHALRKLHVRWFHCTSSRMASMLKAAGIPDKTLKLIDAVVSTCKICRLWTRPTNKSHTSTRLSVSFNEVIQMDILYYQEDVILHMIDEATRWTSACVLPSKSAHDICSSITNTWFRIFGPPTCIISDAESGLTSEEALVWAERWNVDIKTKPQGSHANIVERHHEILRDQLHKIQSQLTAEKIVGVSVNEILSEAIFAKNAFVQIHGTTPYQAVLGRTPKVLSEFESVGVSSLNDTEGGHVAHNKLAIRLREIAIQSIVEGVAADRAKRALQSKARVAGEQLSLKYGD